MKVKLNIPTDLSEVTLEQYQKFHKLDTEENRGSTFLMQKMVEIFCDIDLMNLAKIKYQDVYDIAYQLNQMFDQSYKLKLKVNLDGQEFGFIPILDEISLGEYIDLDENFGDWDKMHKAMAVLYRPITHNKEERYDIEEYQGDKNSELMKKLPLDVVLGSMVFFWNLSDELLRVTLRSLEQDIPLTTEQRQILEENGGGIRASTHYLEEIFKGLKISLN